MTYTDVFRDYRKHCVKYKYPHSTVKIRTVLDCAAMSAIDRVLLVLDLRTDIGHMTLSSAVASRLISLGDAFRDTLTVVVPEK